MIIDSLDSVMIEASIELEALSQIDEGQRLATLVLADIQRRLDESDGPLSAVTVMTMLADVVGIVLLTTSSVCGLPLDVIKREFIRVYMRL